MTAVTIDPDKDPAHGFRIDAFFVPERRVLSSRKQCDATCRSSKQLLGSWGTVSSRRQGPSTFNVVTLAKWESREALKISGAKVRAYYQGIFVGRHCARRPTPARCQSPSA